MDTNYFEESQALFCSGRSLFSEWSLRWQSAAQGLFSLDSDFQNLIKSFRRFPQTRTGTLRRDKSPSPSPRPSPLGRGRHVFRLSEQAGAAEWRRTGERFSLSFGERAGVRGKEVFESQLISNFKNLW